MTATGRKDKDRKLQPTLDDHGTIIAVIVLFTRPSLQQSGPFAHSPCSELLFDLCGGTQPELLSTRER